MISAAVMTSWWAVAIAASMGLAVWERVGIALAILQIADTESLLDREPSRNSSEHKQWEIEARQHLADRETYG